MSFSKHNKLKRRYRKNLCSCFRLDAGTIALLDQRISDIMEGKAKFCRLVNWDTLEFEYLSDEENQEIIDGFRKDRKNYIVKIDTKE